MVREKEQLPFGGHHIQFFFCPLGDITSSFSLSFGGHHIQFFFVLWRTSHPIFLCPSFEGHRTRILCVLGDSMLFLIHSPLHVLVMLRLKFIFCSNVDAWKKTLSAGKTGPAPQKEAEKQHSWPTAGWKYIWSKGTIFVPRRTFCWSYRSSRFGSPH